MSYPVLLHLQGRRAVIVGGGQVAACKCADLLAAGAQITVISPELTPSLLALAEAGHITWLAAVYAPGQLAALRPFLVIAATCVPDVNAQVIADAQALGILAGAADDTSGDFTGMATVRRGAITLAAATGGASPALAAHLRGRLESAVGPEYETLAEWLAGLRPRVRQGLASQAERRAFWRALLDSSALAYLRRGDTLAARAVIDDLLAAAGLTEREELRP
jgi:precorrin-2 dehydrogenase / sirohydrochlorin ferrochelatase